MELKPPYGPHLAQPLSFSFLDRPENWPSLSPPVPLSGPVWPIKAAQLLVTVDPTAENARVPEQNRVGQRPAPETLSISSPPHLLLLPNETTRGGGGCDERGGQRGGEQIGRAHV